jgi:hypothetical protein
VSAAAASKLLNLGSWVNEGKSAASFCCQMAPLVPNMFFNFYLVKNHKIVNNSATNETREKISIYLESLGRIFSHVWSRIFVQVQTIGKVQMLFVCIRKHSFLLLFGFGLNDCKRISICYYSILRIIRSCCRNSNPKVNLNYSPLLMCDPSMSYEQPRQVYEYISMGLGHSQLIHRRVSHNYKYGLLYFYNFLGMFDEI